MSQFVVAIDQSTSASKVVLLDEKGQIVKRFSKNHRQYYPAPCYVEHDANEIFANVVEGIQSVTEGLIPQDITAIGISNQRETTVFWDKATGEPVCKAVVWQDVRASELAKNLAEHATTIHQKTGILLSGYYPAMKAMHVLANDEAIHTKAKEGTLCVGTVDSYLVHRLTGLSHFKTDVSNASRTLWMNLEKLEWDDELLALFGMPKHCLPSITLSDGDFGTTAHADIIQGVPIAGVMGDSHASLFAHGCVNQGMAKATFGTGSSVMMNIGLKPQLSQKGLSASVGFGYQGKTCYVLEGNITCSGDTLCWIRDKGKMVEDVMQVESVANTVEDNGGVYFVPAFSGLGAPHFKEDAKALIVGMTRGSTQAHIVRAALESIVYQDADVLFAICEEAGITLSQLHVDGGPTKNQTLMQFLADIVACDVDCALDTELSALGAGYMAGLSKGLYSDLDSIAKNRKQGGSYHPNMEETTKQALMAGWHDAISRSI